MAKKPEARKLTDAQMQELCEDLRGTTLDINEALARIPGLEGVTFDDFTPADCGELDMAIFECQQCNWWCGQDEASETKDDVCAECADEGE